MAHEAQERYSSLVLAKMRSENILKDGIIFNNDYEGDPVAGAVKVPVRDGEVKVGDYDRSAGGELSESSTEYRSILINREKYVNELVDGYDAACDDCRSPALCYAHQRMEGAYRRERPQGQQAHRFFCGSGAFRVRS